MQVAQVGDVVTGKQAGHGHRNQQHVERGVSQLRDRERQALASGFGRADGEAEYQPNGDHRQDRDAGPEVSGTQGLIDWVSKLPSSFASTTAVMLSPKQRWKGTSSAIV